MLQQYIVLTSIVWCFVLLQYRQLQPVVALSEQSVDELLLRGQIYAVCALQRGQIHAVHLLWAAEAPLTCVPCGRPGCVCVACMCKRPLGQFYYELNHTMSSSKCDQPTSSHLPSQAQQGL